MRLYLSWRERDVVDLTVAVGRKASASLRVWEKTAKTEPKDEGPTLRASGHCSTVERKGWTPAPDTYVFGFGRRN